MPNIPVLIAKGYRHTVEARAQMSAIRKGRPGPWSNGMPDLMKDRLRTAHAGKPCNFTKIEDLRKNAHHANEGRRKPVMCVTDGKTYGSVTEAAKAYDLTFGRVSYLCRGDHKARCGLEFRFAEAVQNDL